MAKGSKLKQALKHHQDVEKYNKEQQLKQIKTAKQIEEQSDAPKIVTKEDLIKAEEEKKAVAEAKAAAEAEKKSQGEEYKSQALSKKDKRKLKKQEQKEAAEEDEEDDEDDEEYQQPEIDVERLTRSDDDMSDDDSEEEEDSEDEEEEEDPEMEEGDVEVDPEAEEDVPLSDVEFDSDADIVPFQKVTINNKKALTAALDRIRLPWEKHSFQEHQTVTSSGKTEESIKDIYNDTERELAFYKQSLEAVLEAKEKLTKLKVPFRRPLDYFAEMVKTDEHMDKLKQKLVKEASEKKAIEEARRQRNLKKFGKQVQVATLQQRQKDKRETLDKIKSLRKKRTSNEVESGDASQFNVAVEDAVSDYKNPTKSKRRQAKDAKYGFGGMKRFKRKNDAESSADVSGYSHKKMKGRPGKSKRSRRH